MSISEDVLSITRTQAVISSMNHLAMTLGIAGSLMSTACATIEEASEKFEVDDGTAIRITSLVLSTIQALIGRLVTVHEMALDGASAHADDNVVTMARAAMATIKETLSGIEAAKRPPESTYVDIATARRIANELVATAQAVMCVLVESAVEPDKTTPPAYLN